MSEALPVFEYFPNPVGHGSIVEDEAICPCCEKNRSHMYRGPIYCTSDVDEVCPWCIHDGSAAAKWDASFNDTYSYPDTVPQSIVKTVAERTPGFVTWQGNHWLFSERDALVFIEEVEGTKLVKGVFVTNG